MDDAPTNAHPTRLCVIDLGTNSFHALIVDAYPNGTFEVVDKIKEAVRLGDRGLSHRVLTRDAVGRAMNALHRIHLLAEGRGVTEYLAYATSAIREAENGRALVAHVLREIGIEIRAIPGELEAHLIYLGVTREVPMSEPALIVDIGGGSTELIVGTSHEPRLETSLKLGAARLTERFVTSDPIDDDDLEALRAHLDAELEPVLAVAREAGVGDLVGSSGTMEALAELCREAGGGGGGSVFQRTFEAKTLLEVTEGLVGSTRAEREAMDALDERRVGQIVAGAVLVEHLARALEPERFRVSPAALREGMVQHWLEHNVERLQRLAPVEDVRRRAVLELAHAYRWDEAHSRQVTRLALALYDACAPLHGHGAEERELLEFAGLLHDVGRLVGRRGHHKHSRYLIEKATWHALSPREVAIVANVARYHRGARPKKKHDAYRALPKKDRKRVDALAAILRIADGLDRSHVQNVEDLAASVTSEALHVTVRTKGDPELELAAARRAASLFERTFERRVTIEAAWRPDAPAGVQSAPEPR